MDDDNDALFVNITSGRSWQGRQGKQKVTRRDRLKARKTKWESDEADVQEQRRESEKKTSVHETKEAEPSETTLTPPAGKPAKRKSETDYSNVAKRTKTSGIVSSLFTANPDIPHVHSKQIEVVKESVFSAKSFRDLDLHPYMVSNLEDKLGLKQMTQVQRRAIPPLLEGHDVLVKSQTGSGKTYAYAIPIVQSLQARTPAIQRSDGPYCVVVVPTRELALQSLDTFQKLVRPFIRIAPGCIMGGEKKKSEKARLRKGVNILVSTPGRLLDHIHTTQSLRLHRVCWLVIDEADRLLDMGFEKDVAQILNALTASSQQKIQTVLVSATLSAGVERLAGMSLQDPCRIDVAQDSGQPGQDVQSLSVPPEGSADRQSGSSSDQFTLPEHLKQYFVVVPQKLRLVTLAAFIQWKCKMEANQSKVIVFFATQDAVEFYHTLLMSVLCSDMDGTEEEDRDRELLLYRLHGDMQQKDRTTTFHEFCEADSGVLLCTDVAARGLDLPQVNWIVQYTVPGSPTDYIHRVGRTARIGSRGQSLMFLAPSEVEYVKVIEGYKINMQELAMDDILHKLLLLSHTGIHRQKKNVSLPHTTQESATALQMKFESCVQGNKQTALLAKKAFLSYVRAYATYPSDVKHIFHIKNLHLGHVAKSFALREAPSKIGGVNLGQHKSSKKSKSKIKQPEEAGSKHGRLHQVSEFASGLEGATGGGTKSRKKKMKFKKR